MDDAILVTAAARELNITVDTLYNWSKRGKCNIVEKSYHERYITLEEFNKLKSESLDKGMKRCKDCGFVGENHEFAPKRHRCVKCYAEYQKQKRLRNIDKISAYNQLRYTGEYKEKSKKRASEWYYKNQQLVKDRVKVYHNKTKEHRKFYALSTCYGLSKEQYEQMLENCDGLCEICKKEPEKICVDHNHTNGQIRGILCSKCNSAIGFLNDDINLVNSAAEYLKRYDSMKTAPE